MASRIPPLLQPYVGEPAESSLTVVTGVLGAGTNWLLMRWLYALLREGEGGVVLVSFMRDLGFWKEGGGKIGLDLDALSRTGRFSYVDGLTGLYTKTPNADPRGRLITSDKPEDVKKVITEAIGGMRGRTVLIVDAADEWVAASGTSGSDAETLLLSLRELVHAAIFTFSADEPLLHSQRTVLERTHAALVVSQAHAADAVISLRMLDTGVARDVSGVMRLSPAGKEYLYHVGGDGSVRVFERGS